MFKKDLMLALKMKGTIGGMWVCLAWNCEWTPAYSWQGNGYLRPTATDTEFCKQPE